uniref:Alternative protein SCARF1 n=1 Tax=Homo sapiens TaxID=9606 RepID=L8EAP7_HUMAN|nr:alternative protein SCARF1 [Homo sapiens]
MIPGPGQTNQSLCASTGKRQGFQASWPRPLAVLPEGPRKAWAETL